MSPGACVQDAPESEPRDLNGGVLNLVESYQRNSAEVKRLRGLVRWFLDGDDHTHADDCGARGQHDRDVCRVAGCGDAECEGPHCTCDATEMRDRARAALGEP